MTRTLLLHLVHLVPKLLFGNVAFLFLASFLCVSEASGQESVRLHETFSQGCQYHVSSRTQLSGSLTLPPTMAKQKEKTLSVSGESTVDYDERVLDGEANRPVEKSLRLYRRLDFRRRIGDQPQENTLRPSVRRLVLMRSKHSEVPFSPDGPLLWAEIELVRTDVFVPALKGLLPDREVRVGDYWRAETLAVEELTDLDQISEGKLDCKLQEIASRDGRRYAQVGLSGTISGLNEDGPNRQQLDGYFFFDLQSNHLSYLYLNGTSWMLDKDGKAMGKIEGKYVLTRKIERNIPELSDAAVRRLTLEPNDDNTLLLFDEPTLGVQFIYPRRWTVRKADARQIALDEPSGGGLLITLEPASQVPTGRQFHAEVAAMLKKQSAKVLSNTPPETVAGSSQLEHFVYEAEEASLALNKGGQGGVKVLLDYYVSRQTAGGATFAGRFPPGEANNLKKDAERIARSLKLVPPKK